MPCRGPDPHVPGHGLSGSCLGLGPAPIAHAPATYPGRHPGTQALLLWPRLTDALAQDSRVTHAHSESTSPAHVTQSAGQKAMLHAHMSVSMCTVRPVLWVSMLNHPLMWPTRPCRSASSPCVLPNACPPPISATVSWSFMPCKQAHPQGCHSRGLLGSDHTPASLVAEVHMVVQREQSAMTGGTVPRLLSLLLFSCQEL